MIKDKVVLKNNRNNSGAKTKVKYLSQRNSNNYIKNNIKNSDKINKSNNLKTNQESQKINSKKQQNFVSFRQDIKKISNNNTQKDKKVAENISKIYKNYENSKKLEVKPNKLASINRKTTPTPHQLKIIKQNSKIDTNNQNVIYQKEKNKKIISERLINKEKKTIFRRSNTASNANRSKLANNNKEKGKEKDKEKINEEVINEVKNINKQQTNKFSIYHFFKTNNIFFFIKNSKYNPDDLQFQPNENFEIINEFILPQAFRPRMNFFGNIPKCIIETCSKGNFSMIKNFDNCNVIWKLLHPDKMRLLIRSLSKHQKFNHFPCTYQLGRKDNLFKHFKFFKKLSPDLFNYIPPSYILPMDIDNFESELKKNKKSVWIVKPLNMSRGRGIRLICGESDYQKIYNNSKKTKNKNNSSENNLILISRYLDKPHLLNNKKYDLRIYVLVGSFTPLKIYLYYNGLVRFATEDYEKGNYSNVFIHLTNYSINKKNPNYKSNQKNNKEIDDLEEIDEENEQEDDSSKWSLVEYKNYFKKDMNIFEKIWKQIEDIVIKTMLTVIEDNCRELSGNKNNNLFELYGFDIFIDESYRAWLLEVNVNPSLHCTSPLDLSIKTDLLIDIFNLIGIPPFNHNNNEDIYKFSNEKNNKENNNKMPEIKLPLINKNNKGESNIINIKQKIEKNFNPDNLRGKIPEYNNEHYKKMIKTFQEEKMRAETTGFSLIFPKKENLEYYANILNKNNFVNDANVVLWEHILNNE